MAPYKGNRRGIGSNQYADKVASPQDDEAVIDQINRMSAYRRPAHHKTALATDTSRRMPTKKVLNSMSEAIDGVVNNVTNGGATESSIRESGMHLAQLEDTILQEHPNTYGTALINALYWSKTATEKDMEYPSARELSVDYAALISDVSADSERRLNVDELTDTLTRISENEDTWYGRRSGGGSGGDRFRYLNCRYAALSTVSSRSPQEDQAKLQEEMQSIEQELVSTQIKKINL